VVIPGTASLTWAVDAISPCTSPILERSDVTRVTRFVHFALDGRAGIRYVYSTEECASNHGAHIWHGRSFIMQDDEFEYGRTPRDPAHVRAPRFVTRLSAERALLRDGETEKYLLAETEALLHAAPDLEPSPHGAGGRPTPGPAFVHVMNVGQGDTIVVVFPDGHAWLTDSYFWRKQAFDGFVTWLREHHPGVKLRRLIISHFHHDHIRSAVDALQEFAPAEVVVPGSRAHPTAATLRLLRECATRGVLRVARGACGAIVAGVSAVVLPTADLVPPGTLTDDPNDHELVVILRRGRSRAVLSGDVPGRILDRVSEHPFLDAGPGGGEGLYKVAHHCSRTGESQALLAALRPTRAATSCGLRNRFEHPHDPPRGTIAGCVVPGGHEITFEVGSPLSYELTVAGIRRV